MSLRKQKTGTGSTYRSGAYTSLLPWQVRERRFKPVGFRRRGLDPDDVYAFLDRVAGDMANVYAALAASRRDTAALKDALRRWQSDQGRIGDARGDQR
ncbi:DivIVA domain-containing protein [Micromonospora terminaliae]|uniref:DivIVA domain-containing protein n=1 Tax=Micromonospora terminaliae TaxID=1914461 RepID=A0AAJ2ZE42_9ACTN|nr:DivIVA domain-containing protein [Micromonospora terminaliae]NES28138.1 DivIVA domain-containing protein [Micromonospora terminaliae]QGL47117.1 DivIVA domain-containing protein [Micromonospora terminaliae]